METQETFDKLEDVIINANRNLAYGTSSGQIGDDINGKDGACSTVSKIFMVSSGEDSDVVNLSEEDDDIPAVNSDDTVMTATAENGSSFGSESGENVADKAVTSNSKTDDETVRDYFIWDQPSGEVRYIHSEKVNGQWQNYNEDPNGDILATGVMDFRADISKAVTDKIVRFQLRTKSGTKTIETLHSVSLRNDLGVSSQIDSPFVNPTGAPKPSVKPTDTPVPTEPPKPTGLTLNKSTVLLAAGTSLNMSNMEISGTVNYDDGTTSSAGSLTWTIDSNCTYATLNGGTIHIQENAGTASSGTVTLTATDTEHNNVSAQMTVYIARLDFSAPANNNSYTVGQEKQLQYRYMEGGYVIESMDGNGTSQIVTIITEQKPANTDYNTDGNFTQNDVGNWKVKALVDLAVRKQQKYDFAYGMVSATNTFSVSGYTAQHVVAVNNKTSIFPGESTQIYLELLRDGQPITDKIDENWTCETINGQTIGNLSPTYYKYAYANGKENLITVTANSQITRVTTYTITVSYKLYNNEPLRTASIDITVTPLTMNLTTSATQIHYGQDPITITADVVDAEHDQHVTDDYNIEWTLNPEDAAIYSLDNLSGKITRLSSNQAPDASRIVTVTATARDKTSGAAICTSSTKITISPKTTIEKSYNCASGKIQKLEFNDEDVNKSSGTIKTSYLTATGSVPVECVRNKIPFLTLNGTNPSDLSITMKEDTSNYENYKYVLISVDLGNVLYNFYIYPLQYNVYDCEYGQDTAPFTYVPTDLESIRKLAKLGSEDEADNGYPGYTYTYTDALGESCYLRLSVYSKTGIGSFSGNYVESSSGKWFMKRKTKNKDQNDDSDQAYYRLYGNKWYKFHSKNSVKRENYATTALYNKAKAERTRYYWDLKDSVHLYDDSGNEIEGEKGIQNTYFWQKWK